MVVCAINTWPFDAKVRSNRIFRFIFEVIAEWIVVNNSTRVGALHFCSHSAWPLWRVRARMQRLVRKFDASSVLSHTRLALSRSTRGGL